MKLCNRLTRRSIAILLATILLCAASDRAEAQDATVRLVVDYGNGVIKTIIHWASS